MMQHPEVEEFQEQVRTARRALLNGLLNFLLSCLVYSAFVWYVTRTLEQADVISFRFDWVESTAIVSSAMFVRMWDRTFLRG